METPLAAMNNEKRARCYEIMQAYKIKRSDQESRSKRMNDSSAVPVVFHMFPDDRKKLDKLLIFMKENVVHFPLRDFKELLIITK